MPLSFKTIQKYSPAMSGGVLFLVDRLFKWLAVDLVKLPYFGNQGLIFSLPVKPLVALPINIFILIIVILVWRKNHHPAFLLIILGGIGNLIDRLIYGSVIDYIFVSSRAPFNLADGLIVIGIVWYLLSSRRNMVS